MSTAETIGVYYPVIGVERVHNAGRLLRARHRWA
jgi:hypothetical protein